MEPIIQFSGADILGGDSAVIYGLDMAIFPGDFVYVVGKVGSGKTSIIRTMTAENRLLNGEGTVCGPSAIGNPGTRRPVSAAASVCLLHGFYAG